MRPAEDIKRLLENAKVKINPEVKKTALNELLSELEKTKITRSAEIRPNVWRIIMKSRITKLAAAAVIIIAAVIGINQLGGSVDGASAAFGIQDAVKATNAVNWVKIMGNFIPSTDCDPSVEKEMADFREVWFCADPCISIIKFGCGDIQFCDANTMSKYFAKTNIIRTRYKKATFHCPFINYRDMFSEMVKNAGEKGASITYADTVYNNRAAKLMTICFNMENKVYTSKIIADSVTRLIMQTQMHIAAKDGKVSESVINLEYPQTGPHNIYDAGARQDAAVYIEGN